MSYGTMLMTTPAKMLRTTVRAGFLQSISTFKKLEAAAVVGRGASDVAAIPESRVAVRVFRVWCRWSGAVEGPTVRAYPLPHGIACYSRGPDTRPYVYRLLVRTCDGLLYHTSLLWVIYAQPRYRGDGVRVALVVDVVPREPAVSAQCGCVVSHTET